MLTWIRGLAALALVIGGIGSALAEPSGKALGVDPAAEATGNAGSRTLVVGADIFIGDRIVTGDRGQVQILFADNTKLVVGPRSALLIEDYLLRDDGSAGKFAVNALSGTFRFVTGRAPKDRFTINTPAGTIGVRGTAGELYVTDLWTYLLQQVGSTINCPRNGGECMILDEKCEYGIMSADSTEIVGHTDNVTGEDREQMKRFFMYAEDESHLDRIFRIADSLRCTNRPTGVVFTGTQVTNNGDDDVEEPPPDYYKPGHSF